MKIAIWTLREPKIQAIKEAIKACPYFSQKEIEYIAQKVPSDVSDMPLSLEETMKGAQNRARNLKNIWVEADFYVGLEWGTFKVGDRTFLLGVVYVENSVWEGHFGLSPAIEVPKKIEKMLYEEGKELGPIMEELSGVVDIRSKNGSMWAWSDDMLTRKEEFVLAFQAAISPFYNSFYKI